MTGIAFALPDSNNDGTVSYEELSTAFEFITSGDLLVYLSIQFEQYDENYDMAISYDEWMNFVESVHESGEILSGTDLAQPVGDAEIAALDAIS